MSPSDSHPAVPAHALWPLLLAAACAYSVDGLPGPSLDSSRPRAAVVGGPTADSPPGEIYDPSRAPARAQVLGFPLDGTIEERRTWMPAGSYDFSEATGPNDKHAIGDFKGLGYDQLLAINYDERQGDARVLLSSLAGDLPAGSPPPTPLYREAWGEASWLDGWDDEEDLALAGDFLALGYDQLLLIHRRGDDMLVPDEPRACIVDLHGPTPVLVFSQQSQDFAAGDFAQREDRILVGDFRRLGHDQVLYINTDPAHQGRALLLHDYALGTPPVAAQLYARSFSQLADLGDWIDAADRSFAGDFIGLGYDQVLLLDRQHGEGRVRVLDLRGTGDPATWYREDRAESALLDGWHDALGDWIFAGDFAGLGRDQLLFFDRRGQGDLAMSVDFGAGKPAGVRYLQPRARATHLTEFLDDDDLVLAGRFSRAPADGLLMFDNARAPKGTPERVVTSVAELEATLASRFRGRVVIPADVDWTLTRQLRLQTGVSLVGARGALGSRPILRFPDRSRLMWGVLFVAGHHVRIEGLHLIGPTNGDRSPSQQASAAITSEVEAASGRGLAVTVVDNEIEQWTFAAFQVANPAYTLTADDQRRPRQAAEDAALIRIERNYLHHVARDGNGYGVHLDGGVYVLVEGNVFDRNRHAVSAAGFVHSGYVARHNLVLEGGFTEQSWWGSYWNQHFDVHGTADEGYGGAAGESFLIEQNTIRGEQDGRPALTLRGRPTIGAFFRDNVLVHDDLDEAVSLKNSRLSTGIGESHSEFHFHPEPGNRYDTDWIEELSTGDFDGDGLADVFWATGTAWYYSSAGDSEWRFLRASPLRRDSLAFADVDGEGRTDVLWSAAGTLYYARAGRGAPVPLAPALAPVAALRFHDFTGDGQVDIFHADGRQWWLWDRDAPIWTAFVSRGGLTSELYFGTFDRLPGVDVLWARTGAWSFHSGARGAVTSWSTPDLPSLAGAVAVDVDRDGTTDLVVRSDSTWQWMRSALEAPRRLRAGIDPARDLPAAMLWGNFDGQGGLDALRWGGDGSKAFLSWQGLGSADAGVEHARAMR